MNAYFEKINKLVEDMNTYAPCKYKLLKCTEEYNFALLECIGEFDTEYFIYKYAYHDSHWDLYLVRCFVSKEKAYAAYKALTASSYC